MYGIGCGPALAPATTPAEIAVNYCTKQLRKKTCPKNLTITIVLKSLKERREMLVFMEFVIPEVSQLFH